MSRVTMEASGEHLGSLFGSPRRPQGCPGLENGALVQAKRRVEVFAEIRKRSLEKRLLDVDRCKGGGKTVSREWMTVF